MAFPQEKSRPFLLAMDAGLKLRPAVADDVDAVMAIERGPGFERWVGRSSADEHREMMADPNYAYLVGEAEGAIVAFAILRDLGDPTGCRYLKRVAVARPDQGVGRAFLEQVVDWTFEQAGAIRFTLDCFAANGRAQRVYEKLGFIHEGVLRDAYLGADGVRRDLAVMAMTRTQRLARRGRL